MSPTKQIQIGVAAFSHVMKNSVSMPSLIRADMMSGPNPSSPMVPDRRDLSAHPCQGDGLVKCLAAR